MAEHKEYSSLPLIVATSAAVVLSFVVGWLLLVPTNDISLSFGREPAAAAPLPVQPPLALPDDATEETAAAQQVVRLDIVPPLAPPADPEPEKLALSVDAELRKARFAADADLLVSPPQGNALYYYTRVLAAEPRHAQAATELDAVLARIALAVSEHLAANEIDAAYELAMRVAGARPNHPLVSAMRSTLNDRSNRLIDRAMNLTRAGDDDAAAAVLGSLRTLPGVDANVLAATDQYVAELRRERIAAERALAEAERAATEEAVASWSEKVRGAIRAGQLVSPNGDSARDFLAERDGPKDSKDALTGELLAALLAAGQQSLDDGDLETGETLLAAASDLRADAEGLPELRDALRARIIALEEAKVLELSDFVRINTPPVRYPHIATRLELTGWVEVLFTVTSSGETADIEVVNAEPAEIFDESAISAVEQWTFRPREFRGQLLNQRARARVVFELN